MPGQEPQWLESVSVAPLVLFAGLAGTRGSKFAEKPCGGSRGGRLPWTPESERATRAIVCVTVSTALTGMACCSPISPEDTYGHAIQDERLLFSNPGPAYRSIHTEKAMGLQHSDHTGAACPKCRCDLFTLRLLSGSLEFPTPSRPVAAARTPEATHCPNWQRSRRVQVLVRPLRREE
jgi:hypothetical protein